MVSISTYKDNGTLIENGKSNGMSLFSNSIDMLKINISFFYKIYQSIKENYDQLSKIKVFTDLLIINSRSVFWGFKLEVLKYFKALEKVFN